MFLEARLHREEKRREEKRRDVGVGVGGRTKLECILKD
jgi:hypothetical protein